MEQLELEQKKSWVRSTVSMTYARAGLYLIVACVAAFGLGNASPRLVAIGYEPVYDTRAPEEVDLAPLFVAWNLLNRHYAPATTATTTAEEKLYGAIQGLAASYGDDYTVFFPPAQKQLFETEVSGGFEGVGMEIGKRNGILTVIAPIKDTPAYRAGIQSGDLILKIDGESTLDMAVDEAVMHIRGQRGTGVTLTLSRERKDDGKEFDLTVIRDTITLPTLDASVRPDGIHVIKIHSFNAQSPQLFSDAIQRFAREGGERLIIDLRGNPGGYLEAAVDIASWFLPTGVPVVIQDYGGTRDEVVYRSSGIGPLHRNPPAVAVLIDGGSASASEIFAGALRDNGFATLIGQKSFGKGSVQQLFDVTEDTQLKITIARWLTPNRTSLSHHGIEPDIAVERTAEDREAGLDPQLERAAVLLLER